MSNYLSAKPGKEKVQRIFAGILLLSWLVLGNGGLGVASTTPALLHIQGDRITGVLSQVPLRTVLEQLHEKLAIKYVVLGEELDKPVSANLSGEPVTTSLSKILASWDYALQLDQQGRVQQIFVVAKMGAMEAEKSVGKTSKSPMNTFPRKVTRSEPILKTSKPQVLLPGARINSNSKEGSMVSPMSIGSSEKLRPMVIQPSQGRSMKIQPSSNSMEIIPAEGYPPMDVLPVSEEAQREFSELLN